MSASLPAVLGWKFDHMSGISCSEVDGVMTIVEFPGEMPTQQDIDQWTLEYKKHLKKIELREACRAHIFAGFDSDALGTVHRYPLSQTDQANNQKTEVSAIKNADTVGWTRIMQCIDSNGIIAYRHHTAEQVLKVVAAIEEGSEEALLKLQDLIGQVDAATTEIEIDAIIW